MKTKIGIEGFTITIDVADMAGEESVELERSILNAAVEVLRFSARTSRAVAEQRGPGWEEDLEYADRCRKLAWELHAIRKESWEIHR